MRKSNVHVFHFMRHLDSTRFFITIFFSSNRYAAGVCAANCQKKEIFVVLIKFN